MKKSVVYISFFILSLYAGNIYSQQLPVYSQYVMNSFLYNPATVGSTGQTMFNLTAREQWIGFKDAPRTHSFSFQTRLLKKDYVIKNQQGKNKMYKPKRSGRVGLGGFIYNDKNGLVSRTGGQFSYGYHTFIRSTQLSFGISGSVFQLKIHDDEFVPHDQDDPLLNGNLDRSIWVPDAAVGLYVQNPYYFAGLSAAHLFESIKIGNNSLKDYRIRRHYFLHGGYSFYIDKNFILEPSFLLKTTERFNFQNDITIKCYIQKEYWVGLSYRTLGTIVALFGVRMNNLYIGYAFDYNTNELRKYTFGSHEFVFAYKIGSTARRYRWIERF